MTRSLSKNLIKSYNGISQNQEKRIIDSNAVIAKKMEVLREFFGETLGGSETNDQDNEMVEGLNAEHIDLLQEETPDGTKVIKAEKPAAVNTDELIKKAQDEISAMKKDAMDEIETLRKNTIKKAHEEGYQAGFTEGKKKTDILEKNVQNHELQLQKKEQELVDLYEKKIDELEPLFVDKLINIFNHVIHISVDEYRDTILFLIDRTLKNIESNTNLLVHVSKEDYPLISMQKNRLCEKMAETTSLDIIEDLTLHKNECFIETDSGIFDCGLTTQMDELEKELRMLSYEGN